jgi:uncharacterized protein DUF1579
MKFFARVQMLVAATATWMAALSTARAEGPRTADHARLGVFIGKWNVVGDVTPSALSPGGHFSGVHNGAWDFGGNFVVMRYSGTDNGRAVTQIDLFGWDADSKRYTYDSFNSLGQRANFTGSVAGDTWTWSAERTAGGTRLLMRMVQHVTAETMTWKIETSTDGTHWATAVTGQAKRAH